jgi:hypothetical protein
MPLVIVGNEEDITLVLETLSLDSRSSAFDANLRERIKEVVDNAILVPIGANNEKAAE